MYLPNSVCCVFQQAVETGFGLQFTELPCIDSVCENK